MKATCVFVFLLFNLSVAYGNCAVPLYLRSFCSFNKATENFSMKIASQKMTQNPQAQNGIATVKETKRKK